MGPFKALRAGWWGRRRNGNADCVDDARLSLLAAVEAWEMLPLKAAVAGRKCVGLDIHGLCLLLKDSTMSILYRTKQIAVKLLFYSLCCIRKQLHLSCIPLFPLLSVHSNATIHIHDLFLLQPMSVASQNLSSSF